MKGKCVIITGCTSGIGKETALNLAKMGAKVIMACRNVEVANRIRDEFIVETKNQEISVRKLDLTSLKSVRLFAKRINEEENRLDVLIHNAGMGIISRKTTEDDLEITMATNHYGPFLLTTLLIDLLKRSAPSRVIVVSSCAHRVGWLNLKYLSNPRKYYIPGYMYPISKRANVVFTLELARRLHGTGVTANCLHPGIIKTEIWRDIPKFIKPAVMFMLKIVFRSVEKGARTSIYLASSDDVANVTGKYFVDCEENWIDCFVRKTEIGRKLWELSEKLVKLQQNEPRITY